MESLFIEIDRSAFSATNDIIIGVIYRMPDFSVEVFNERINDIMSTIQRKNKTCYLIGDLNIDFLKIDGHKPTSDFLDTIYSHILFPLIPKPTRVTSHSVTLLDHILTNNFDAFSSNFQRIMCSSFSDHYAVFHVTSSYSVENYSDKYTLKRDIKPLIAQTFLNEIQEIDWTDVSIETDAHAYRKFHKIISGKYNKCFPLRKNWLYIMIENLGWLQAKESQSK